MKFLYEIVGDKTIFHADYMDLRRRKRFAFEDDYICQQTNII
jgi:hypothetical protein